MSEGCRSFQEGGQGEWLKSLNGMAFLELLECPELVLSIAWGLVQEQVGLGKLNYDFEFYDMIWMKTEEIVVERDWVVKMFRLIDELLEIRTRELIDVYVGKSQLSKNMGEKGNELSLRTQVDVLTVGTVYLWGVLIGNGNWDLYPKIGEN